MKKILIIGATSAIAQACARIWAAEGAQFFLVARDAEKLAQTAADLKGRGAGRVTSHRMDATDFDTHEEMLRACLAELHQIDIALLAHGTLPDQHACEQDIPLLLAQYSVNCTSTLALLTRLAQHFEVQHCGTLAVISSVAGERGRPSNYVYGSAKAAVSAFCEGLRARLFKQGVQVLTIKPGFVDTPMTRGLDLPAALTTSPEQVARRIVSAIGRKKSVVYAPGFWALIMLVIRSLPQPLFKRLNL